MRLPIPDGDADKEERGRVLIVGGSVQTPGAVMLGARAALRAGAGKLRIATVRSIAPSIALFIPEARVFALAESSEGSIAGSAGPAIADLASQVDAVAVGAGLIDEKLSKAMVAGMFKRYSGPPVVLDAGALDAFRINSNLLSEMGGRCVLTPHAGEMAKLLDVPLEELTSKREFYAEMAAARFGSVIVLKGPETLIASPEEGIYINRAGNVGLATSGSGDVLSGLIAGIIARGADSLTAAVWGVYLHARAGDELARRTGKVGYLASEISAEIPRLLERLDG
jgi:ADP-dependent NAD(P)H-hydrate dehydratase